MISFIDGSRCELNAMKEYLESVLGFMLGSEILPEHKKTLLELASTPRHLLDLYHVKEELNYYGTGPSGTVMSSGPDRLGPA